VHTQKKGKQAPEKYSVAKRVMQGKVPVTALRSNQLKKKMQTSQQSLQRSPLFVPRLGVQSEL
uniref:Uncharacterized protein n=3 Tax=Sus scrofa TaxID=9823 RepID=A0A8D0J3I5_PIG